MTYSNPVYLEQMKKLGKEVDDSGFVDQHPLTKEKEDSYLDFDDESDKDDSFVPHFNKDKTVENNDLLSSISFKTGGKNIEVKTKEEENPVEEVKLAKEIESKEEVIENEVKEEKPMNTIKFKLS